MGFMKPDVPDVDETTWAAMPHGERVRVMAQHWVEHGFGTPTAIFLVYVLKCALYVLGAAWIVSLTPGIGGLGDVSDWWDAPIVYQKLVVWTLLWEVLGLGCGWGPLTSRFVPPMGGFLYWLRPGTIRLAPWPGRVPLTAGSRRTLLDVALYAGVLVSAGWFMTRSAAADGLLDPAQGIPLIVLLAVLGLRDKTIFLAARGEQYWLTLFLFFFAFSDELVGFKLVMLALWWGAATSKLNRHFPYVVAVMMSNSPFMRVGWVKRKMYRNPPEDLRPSIVPTLLAHVGTTVELLVPFFLVFLGQGGPLTWAALIFMAVFHLHILSTVPMGVPLEWNLFFIFSLFYLFGAHGDTTVWDLSNPAVLLILVPLVGLPFLGNVAPRLVSFLPSMRYYAGNWATSTWFFHGDAEDRMEAGVTGPSRLTQHQLALLYPPETVDRLMHKVPAWRAMHGQGRVHVGLGPRAVGGDLTGWSPRDGEIIAGFAVGWNFGEGHLHNAQLLQAVQERCHFASGEVRLLVLESQPIQTQTQVYEIWDAADGLVERGRVRVADMLTRQPWPAPGDEFPVHDVERPATRTAPA